MKIGILALQGAFIEHQIILDSLGVDTCQVRLPQQLDGLDGIILPGGESTTIGKLMVAFDLFEPLRAFGRQKAIWGTCAGAILLSKDAGRDQPLLGLMDMTIQRNAFGRQVESFEAALKVPALANLNGKDQNPPYLAMFIRAPIIASVGPEVEVVSSLEDGRIVAARQGKLLATSFHPELTGDDRFHRWFLELVKRAA